MQAPQRKLEIFSKAAFGYLLHIVHIITVIGTVALCFNNLNGTGPDFDVSYNVRESQRHQNSANLYLKLFIICGSMLNLIYSWTFLYASRFAIKGYIFWKTSPWLFSGLMVHGLPFLTKFVNMSPIVYWGFFPASLALFLALYMGIFMRMDHPMVEYLRPYVYTTVVNPHDSLESGIYGPPHVIHSSFSGQPPVTMRYGSQALANRPF